MAGTPNSFEVQIDNFLEQFKRSASKAMDCDWVTVTAPQQMPQTPQHQKQQQTSRPVSIHSSNSNEIADSCSNLLLNSNTRNSCIDIAELALSGMND